MKILLVSSKKTIEENFEALHSSRCGIEVFPAIDFKSLRTRPLNLEGCEWLIISSRKVFDFLAHLCSRDDLKKLKIAAVGEATARYLRSQKVRVDFVSSRFTGKDFAQEFVALYPGTQGKILRPLSASASDEIEGIFREHGMDVEVFPLYKPVLPTFPEEEIARIKKEAFDGVAFTSPSAWENFKRLFGADYPRFLQNKVLGAIGPTTARAVEKDGCRINLMPETHTLAALIKKFEGVMP